MRINVSFDQATSSIPAAFVTAVQQVVDYVDSLFTNPITFNLHVGFGEVNGHTLGTGSLGSSSYYLNSVGYSQLRTALSNHATSADDLAAVNSLPASDPTNGGHFWATQVEDLALSLIPSTTVVDAYVGFNGTVGFDYDRSDGIAAGKYDFFGTALHEITEVMGRGLEVGGSIGSTANSYEPLDLFHYSAPGVHTFSGTNPGYFSIDGGATNLDNFNTDPNGDFGDWAASAGHDAFLAFSSPGVLNNLSDTDLREMDILGYDRASAPASSQPSVPPDPMATLAAADLNGDHTSDILWRNTNGDTLMWGMSNDRLQTAVDLGVVSNTWHIEGTGDFNGDHTSDVLWRNDNGDTYEWGMSNGHLQSVVDLGVVSTTWHIAATGDFNADATSDVLWRNDNGDAFIWGMNNGHLQTAVDLGVVDASWHIAGTGDFNNDATSDILWRNNNGDTFIWGMNNDHLQTAIDLGVVDPSWHIAGTGDFNGDATSDILWRNANGDTFLWEMNNGRLQATVDLGVVSADWHIVGVGDYNGDATSDILWRNDNGDTYLWGMSNGHLQTVVDLGIVDQSWKVAQSHSDLV